MKILFVLNLRYNKSGITEQILFLKDRLECESFNVKLVSTFGNIFERIKGVINTFRYANESDLIIGVGCSYFGFFPVFIAAMAAFFLNKKILFNFHGGQAERFFDKYNYFVKHIFNNKKIIVASDYLENVFKSYKYDVVKINNIFNFDSFPKNSGEFKWNKNILWARSFEELYQPELALEVAKILTEKYDYKFYFFGDGSSFEKLKNKYESSNIIFGGLIERKVLLDEYQKFSILLNTTLNDNIPNTIFEAGFYNLLVVSSRVGGIATTFGSNEVLFVEKNNIEAYVNTILTAYDEKQKYDIVRENLNKKIINYNWENVKDKWKDVLSLYEK
ncbi:MAG: glycosyltransferase family 4 protein [Ignavibacteria bacterium]